jgi:hypothetical protein
MYQRDMVFVYPTSDISDLTIAPNAESRPKKKMLSTTVMMTTMIAVIIVSRLDGQTTFAVSARTCRMNSPGVVFATVVCFHMLLQTAARPRPDRNGKSRNVAK